jgi:hypothetical protein
METRTDSKDLSLLAISYLDAEGKDLAAADFLRIVGKVERYSQRQVILRGITDRLVSKSADATALAAYLVSLNATSSDPADQAKYTSSNALWTKLAAAASADDDTKLLTAAAEEGNLWQEELRLVETSRYRPDLLPIDKLVELSIKWSDKFYSRSDAAVSLFTADVMNCLLGRYAVKGVTNENIERFFAGYLGKPYTDPSQATFHTYLSDLSQRGMQPLADKLAQMAKTSGNWMASRSYHTWEVEKAMDSKDLSAALTALSAFDRGDAGQYLQDFVLSALNDPLRKALWDEVVSNEPEVALSALNDRRFRGPSELETALDSLPRIYGTKDISEERRLQAQALYARLLWIVRDKQRLGRLAFHPENIDPIVWYMASDELMGLYSKADN